MSTLLELRDLTVRFPVTVKSGRRRSRAQLTAVDSVSLSVRSGQSLGIVGESGCGKSTLASAMVGLRALDEGSIVLDGTEIEGARGREISRRVQMVFQDPMSSLNPRMTVGQTIAEVLRFHRLVPVTRIRERSLELLAMVELPAALLDRRPRSLSGGQRQRIGIVRALAAEPDVLILDEAVAALDVSVQASVLTLLQKLQRELGLTMVFISHDLSVVRNICDEVAVMYLGQIVERAPSTEVFDTPRHPYTAALLRAAPHLENLRPPGASALTGEPPSPIDPPAGCRFHPRCPIAQDVCARVVPPSVGTGQGVVECHFPLGLTTEESSLIAG